MGKADLDQYQPETDAILDLIPAAGAPTSPCASPAPSSPSSSSAGATATNFRDKYASELHASPRLTLVVNTNLADLRLDPTLTPVEHAGFRSYEAGDPGFALRARAYALCCGGIENPRLLLNLTAQTPAGLGNAAGLAGQYFCEHPRHVLAEAIFRRPLPDLSFFSPTPEFMREHEVLNSGMQIEKVPAPFVRQPSTIAGDPVCTDPFILRLAERWET